MVKNRTRLLYALCLLFAGGAAAFAQSLTISQVDTGGLLSRQEISLYLTATDRFGSQIKDLSKDSLKIYESLENGELSEVDITGIEGSANRDLGVTFFLLIDNSGSMYDTLQGKATEQVEEMRITAARKAIRTFLNEIRNPDDRVGIASFNTFYTIHTDPVREKGGLHEHLDKIERPEKSAAYTELYAALVKASSDTANAAGRRVLIVLSDGENFPIFERTGEAHPEYGTLVSTHEDVIDACRRDGISVFAVNFGGDGDFRLWDIAGQTGGLTYNANNESELANVYQSIRERVLQEYRVSYRALVSPTDSRRVVVELGASSGAVRSEQVYYPSSMFGLPAPKFGWLYLIPFLAGLGIWFLVTLLRFHNRRTDANLEVLGGKTQVFGLDKGETVIGPSANADVTLAARGVTGNTGGTGEATVVYDERSGAYTVVAPGEIRVNNQLTKKKKLEPGDVLNLDGTIIVFDKGEE